MVCEFVKDRYNPVYYGLNPCFNGIWSASDDGLNDSLFEGSLNPCFNGIWSASELEIVDEHYSFVLILVLMEYGLREG